MYIYDQWLEKEYEPSKWWTFLCDFQVKIHKLLLESRYRTRNKEEADLFFVPAYVKCIMVMAGLTEETINQTYVEVMSSFHHLEITYIPL